MTAFASLGGTRFLVELPNACTNWQGLLDLLHVDVKKLGRIPDGGGWRADPAQNARNHRSSDRRICFDYVHVAVDDHSRLAYAEALPDEKGPTCTAFLSGAAVFMTANGAPGQTRHDR